MQNNVSKILIFILTIILLIVIDPFNSGLLSNDNNKKQNFKNVNTVIELIKSHYVDSVNDQKLNEKIINSILNELDPHSTYISKENMQTVNEDMQGSFSGIGIQFNIIQHSVVVIAAISGGPSEKLGIVSGDRIVEVNGETIAGIDIKNEDVINKLRGKAKSVVNIKIYRRGSLDLISFSIIRDDIPLYSVDCSIMLNKDIGYIKINRFSATTYNEFISGSEKLLKLGMNQLILDLRGNPGGYLEMAIKITDEILKKDNLIVYTEGRNRTKNEFYSTNGGILENTPLVILIDEGSASASEIVSGAIQDNNRGLIIGKRSFGKGLVQEQISLSDGSVVRLTTQRYFTPSGRCIQKSYKKDSINDNIISKTKKVHKILDEGGILPDIEVKTDSTLNYSEINLIISKGWINEFTLNYSLLLKKTNQNLSEDKFINSINEDQFLKSFLIFLEEKNYEFQLNPKDKEVEILKNILKANIGRNIWSEEVYYKIICSKDDFINTAKKNHEIN